MTLKEIQILLERASEAIRYGQPNDETQWAYNEGIEDLSIELENLINKKSK
jgi:hypothetical protein|tara:strand:- start:5528 stop:5680 length:153 start_codon:yes stop_codon:yes gene_type:complete